MFRNPFSFNGRIRRVEYGLSNIIYMVIAIIGLLITDAVSMLSGAWGAISMIIYVPLIWFMLAQGAKRCHDRDNNGWYQFIPFYGFWMLFAPGDKRENRYGKDPKRLYDFDREEVLDDELLRYSDD